MLLTLRALLAILLLPVTVAIVVPGFILHSDEQASILWGTALRVRAILLALAAILGASGLVLAARTIVLFFGVGKGTLAPWDPPKKLVVAGPYRYVRNPMISGLVGILVAEAIVAGSLPLAVWPVVFWLTNAIYFVASEEPSLERRFGASYTEYKRNVPRWIPRRHPWHAPKG